MAILFENTKRIIPSFMSIKYRFSRGPERKELLAIILANLLPDRSSVDGWFDDFDTVWIHVDSWLLPIVSPEEKSEEFKVTKIIAEDVDVIGVHSVSLSSMLCSCISAILSHSEEAPIYKI